MNVQQLGVRTARIDEGILFVLGLCSTWQIVKIGSFALFTPLLLAAMLYFLLSRKPVLRRDWMLWAMLILYTVTTLLSPVRSIRSDYKSVAVMAYIQWLAALILCQYASQSNTMDGTGAFLRGFDCSCYVQLGWCIAQLLLYKLFEIDLNRLVFGQLLGYQGTVSHYREGVLSPSGLHWHAANMVPILVFTFFRNKSLPVKLICVAVAYFTKQATALIAVFLCVGCELLVVAKRMLLDHHGKMKRKNAILGLTVLGVCVLLGGVLLPKIQSMLSYLMLRMLNALNFNMDDLSSATHLSYYTCIPYIYARIPVSQILLGAGMNTSGYYFSQFFLQYTDQTWVLESDFANLLLSTGILGTAAHYLFIFVTVWRMHKNDKEERGSWALLVLIACGFFYNNQFNWVLLAELMLYADTRRKKRLKGLNPQPDIQGRST